MEDHYNPASFIITTNLLSMALWIFNIYNDITLPSLNCFHCELCRLEHHVTMGFNTYFKRHKEQSITAYSYLITKGKTNLYIFTCFTKPQ